jgi:hypothetical protein
MPRLVITLLLALGFVFSGPAASARAQAPITLAELKLSFWPEYDQPATLVIYRGTLAPDTPLPVPLKFDIPARYGPPVAVAFAGENGQLLNLDHTTSITGETMTIAFEAPTLKFQFEYYDTGLDLTSSAREYTFASVAPYAIQSLIVEVQQPVEASGLSATPALTAAPPGEDGLIYFQNVFSDVSAGAPITLNLSYSKTTNALTVDSFQPIVTPDLPPGSVQPATVAFGWPLAIGAAAVLLLAGGLVWFVLSRAARSELESEPQRRAKPKGSPPRPREIRPTTYPVGAAPESETESPAVFCHECGQRSQPGDRFCRSCGTELRR